MTDVSVLLQARALTKEYGSGRCRTLAVSDASLTIEEGETVALMGPSGCGKSTLLAMLGLMLPPTSGTLAVAGKDVGGSDRERARLRNAFFGYLHQDFAIVGDDSVANNVAIPLEYRRPRLRRAERSRRCHTALSEVGLEWAAKEKRASRLSGGEQQRVAIARALVNEPRLVLADEPTAALDAITAQEIVSLILDITRRGASVLVATHDPRVAQRCDRTLLMEDIAAPSGHTAHLATGSP